MTILAISSNIQSYRQAPPNNLLMSCSGSRYFPLCRRLLLELDNFWELFCDQLNELDHCGAMWAKVAFEQLSGNSIFAIISHLSLACHTSRRVMTWFAYVVRSSTRPERSGHGFRPHACRRQSRRRDGRGRARSLGFDWNERQFLGGMLEGPTFSGQRISNSVVGAGTSARTPGAQDSNLHDHPSLHALISQLGLTSACRKPSRPSSARLARDPPGSRSAQAPESAARDPRHEPSLEHSFGQCFERPPVRQGRAEGGVGFLLRASLRRVTCAA